MPLYEYQCQACGEKSEVLQRFADPPLAACPKCGGEVKKLVSSPAFQFKGTGWYATDYAAKKGGDSQAGGKSEGDGAKAEAKSEASAGKSEASESKAAAKSEAKAESSKPKETSTAGKD